MFKKYMEKLDERDEKIDFLIGKIIGEFKTDKNKR